MLRLESFWSALIREAACIPLALRRGVRWEQMLASGVSEMAGAVSDPACVWSNGIYFRNLLEAFLSLHYCSKSSLRGKKKMQPLYGCSWVRAVVMSVMPVSERGWVLSSW